MAMKLRLTISKDVHPDVEKEVFCFDKGIDDNAMIGLTLDEAKQILKQIQRTVVEQQAEAYVERHRHCLRCGKNHPIKGYHDVQYRTLFGIVTLRSPRLYDCRCESGAATTFSPLSQWLDGEHVSPELKYLETKWASLMSYGMTADLLKDVLPVGESLNAASVRNHLQAVAQRQEASLGDEQFAYVDGCPLEWEQLPRPDGPITVGIDGGYVRDWSKKKSNFEVITGKSVPRDGEAKRFGFVQSYDEKPKRRLFELLLSQGMQMNQQITFLSDGADNVRELQLYLNPQSKHYLDWFHLTMRLTVLNQFAKGLVHSDEVLGISLEEQLESTKWYLWHGNVYEALIKIDDCETDLECAENDYPNLGKFLKTLQEFRTYVENNQALIPNYGERWRYGETISTAFVESTVNQVVAKRFVKKQQMQWTKEGAHLLLQTRTAVLNKELDKQFQNWYPNFRSSDGVELKMAA